MTRYVVMGGSIVAEVVSQTAYMICGSVSKVRKESVIPLMGTASRSTRRKSVSSRLRMPSGAVDSIGVEAEARAVDRLDLVEDLLWGVRRAVPAVVAGVALEALSSLGAGGSWDAGDSRCVLAPWAPSAPLGPDGSWLALKPLASSDRFEVPPRRVKARSESGRPVRGAA